MPAARHVEVAIIGCGPVGATLAGLLGREGIAVAVFDKAEAVHPQPRAVGFDHDAMRLFQRIGAADALAPHIADFRDSRYYGADGQVIRNVVRLPPPFPLHWAPNYTCDQPGVEAVLRATLARLPSVQMRLGAELLQLEDDGERVCFDVREGQGAVQRWSARYLVGCDGASSTVRRRIGVALESMEYDEPWIVVDLQVDPAWLDRLPQTNVQYCEPERPCTFIVCPGNHRRWEFMLVDGEPREGALAEQRLWQLLARWIGPAHARIWRAAAYRFHALVARDWQAGRVLLAGDSAHQTPPFLGQGMCQGLRDAGNLAWKLAMVLQGRAPAQLLESFTQERRPHVEATTRLAKEIGHMLSERDPARARARDARMLAEGGGAAATLIRQEMIPGLRDGLVELRAPQAGTALPQPCVTRADGSSCLLDDLLRPCFRLVATREAATPALHAMAREVQLPLVVLHGPGELLPAHPAGGATDVIDVTEPDGLLRHWFRAHGLAGALVRPDHYLVGGFADPVGAQALVQMLARRLAPRPLVTA